MERLTKRIDGYAHGAEGVSKDKLTGAYCRGEFEATACVDKLAEYEDLEDKLDQQFNGCISMGGIIDSFIEYHKQNSEDEQIADALLITNDSARRYREWKKLEEQDLLLKLPCKVWDAVYMPHINTILKRKIDVINIYRYTMRIHLCNTSIFLEPSDFGKTVFLTQAEAEKALKGMEGKNEC